MAQNAPSERVYVSNLPVGLDDAKLKEIFGAYGTIRESKVLQNNSAIINFASLDEAKWIVENLDGNMPEGIAQPVGMKFANPPRSHGKGDAGGWGANRSSPYGKGGGDKGSGKGDGKGSIVVLKQGLMNLGVLPGGKGKGRNDANQLYVKGLPSDTTDGDLHDIFGPFGAIPAKGVKAMQTPEGTCSGIGFVDYVDESCAQMAMQTLNGTMLPDGTTLRIHVKNSSKGKGKGKDS